MAVLLVPFAASADDIGDLISTIDVANQRCTQARARDCNFPTRRQAVPVTAADLKPFERSSIKDVNGRDLSISIIPEDKLGEIRAAVRTNMRIYDDEVCAQRSHVMGDELAKAGIETAKIFVEPESSLLFPNYIYPDEKVRTGSGRISGWKFHVASLFYVRKADGSLVEYVYDPFLESKPVPRSYWESRLRANPKSSVGAISLTSRYIQYPRDKYDQRAGYDDPELQRAREIMNGAPKY